MMCACLCICVREKRRSINQVPSQHCSVLALSKPPQTFQEMQLLHHHYCKQGEPKKEIVNSTANITDIIFEI